MDWLAPGCGYSLTGPDVGLVDAAIRSLVAGRMVDVVVSPAAQDAGGFADSTMVIGETLMNWRFRRSRTRRAITARAMNGEIGFLEGALRNGIGCCAVLPQSALEETGPGAFHPAPGPWFRP